MRKIILILFLSIAGPAVAQDMGIIEGFVLDKEMNNDPLAFTSLSIKEGKISVVSDIDGAYAFDVKVGKYTLVFNFTGYQKVEVPNVIVKSGEITTVKNVLMSAIELTPFEEAIVPKEKE